MQTTRGVLYTIGSNLHDSGSAFDPDSCYIVPITAVTPRGTDTALEDVTLAPGNTGVPQAIYSLDWYFNAAGEWVWWSYPVGWAPSVPEDFCTVIGVAWVDSTTPTTLKGYELLPSPQVLSTTSSEFNLLPRYQVDERGVRLTSIPLT